jgi:hypothetical protein
MRVFVFEFPDLLPILPYLNDPQKQLLLGLEGFEILN